MLPRWHILLGIILTALIWIFNPNINIIYPVLLFLSSVLIDFDHYAASCSKSKKIISLKESFKYHEDQKKRMLVEKSRGIRKKADFHIFHTIEFQAIIGLFGFFWVGFFYIFLGMVFHSLSDLIYLLYKDFFYAREFFLFNWLRKKIF